MKNEKYQFYCDLRAAESIFCLHKKLEPQKIQCVFWQRPPVL